MKFALALTAMLIITIPLFGQEVGAEDNLKTVGIDSFTVGDPIRVVRVMEGSTQIVPKVPSRRPSGQPFQAGENWLKDLTFVVKNLSDKTSWAFGAPPSMKIGFSGLVREDGSVCGTSIRGWRLLGGRENLCGHRSRR